MTIFVGDPELSCWTCSLRLAGPAGAVLVELGDNISILADRACPDQWVAIDVRPDPENEQLRSALAELASGSDQLLEAPPSRASRVEVELNRETIQALSDVFRLRDDREQAHHELPPPVAAVLDLELAAAELSTPTGLGLHELAEKRIRHGTALLTKTPAERLRTLGGVPVRKTVLLIQSIRSRVRDTVIQGQLDELLADLEPNHEPDPAYATGFHLGALAKVRGGRASAGEGGLGVPDSLDRFTVAPGGRTVTLTGSTRLGLSSEANALLDDRTLRVVVHALADPEVINVWAYATTEGGGILGANRFEPATEGTLEAVIRLANADQLHHVDIAPPPSVLRTGNIIETVQSAITIGTMAIALERLARMGTAPRVEQDPWSEAAHAWERSAATWWSTNQADVAALALNYSGSVRATGDLGRSDEVARLAAALGQGWSRPILDHPRAPEHPRTWEWVAYSLMQATG